MSNKLIGIVANHNPEEGRFWINSNYVRYFETYGTVTLVDPVTDKINPNLDLLVLPGGADVSPNRYGHFHAEYIGFPNRALETFDHHLLPLYLKSGCSTFAICRGFQSLNVLLGGKLNPHVGTHPQSQYDGAPVHYVGHADRSNMMFSSSNHHQVIEESMLAPDLEALLFSYEMVQVKENNKWKPHAGDKEDIVEFYRHRNARVAGCEFHPEKNFLSGEGKPTCKALEQYTRDWINKIMG